MTKNKSWLRFTFRKQKPSFLGPIIKSSLFLLAVVALGYGGLRLDSYTADLTRQVEGLKQANATVTEELSTLRGFLLNSCQEENDVRNYLFLPEKNCGKYFPDLITREISKKPLEEEFLAAFHELILTQNETLAADLTSLETDDEEGVKSASLAEPAAEEAPVNNVQMTAEAITRLAQDKPIEQYLEEYGYRLVPFGGLGIHLKQGEENIADIFWDTGENTAMLNLLREEKIIPLTRLSGRIYEWKHRQSTETREEMLEKIRNTEGDSVPRRNILILGKNGGNVDTIIFASVDHVRESITLLSVPRDLWFESRKINSLYAFFGIEHLMQTLEEVMGQDIHNYVLIDMLAFPEVIDAIGGIDYTFEQPLIDPSYRTVDDGEEGTLFFSSGRHHLSGIEALRVARSRNTTSDFHRAERQQKLLDAIKRKLAKNGKLDSIVAITPVLFRHVQTDIEATEAAQLFWKTRDYRVNFGNVMSTKNILNSTMLPLGNGLRTYVLLPKDNDWDLIKKYVWRVLLEHDIESP